MDSGFEQRVRERAYEIWVGAGMEEGLADLHWLSAEQAVMGESVTPITKRAKKTAKPKSAMAVPARKSSKAKAAA